MLSTIRNEFSSEFKTDQWHFIEGNLDDLDKYHAIKQKKLLFRWNRVVGNWHSTQAECRANLYACYFLEQNEMKDVQRSNDYKTNKFNEIVDDVQTVLNRVFDPETSALRPEGEYTFRFFEDRFAENLAVVEIELNFLSLDFFCDNVNA